MSVYFCTICGKPLVKDKPNFMPLGDDAVLRIVNETCGGAYINENQEKTYITNKAAHDKLIQHMKVRLENEKKNKSMLRSGS